MEGMHLERLIFQLSCHVALRITTCSMLHCQLFGAGLRGKTK
jgi:hypothetical protein